MAKRNEVAEEKPQISALQYLEDNIVLYANLKSSLNELKKREAEMNGQIKAAMAELKKEELEVSGFKISCKTSYKQSFIDDKVIALVKDKGIKGVIVTKEVVDEEALQKAVYDGKIAPIELKDCEESKEVVTLLVKAAK